MFWDYSITVQEWHDMPPEQKRQRRIRIRAYFLWQNGMPGTDDDRTAMAEFESQFDDMLYQMECRRSSDYTPEADRLLLLVAQHLVGILRIPPNDIGNTTMLPTDKAMLNYLQARINYTGIRSYTQGPFFRAVTVGQLVQELLAEDLRERPVFAD